MSKDSKLYYHKPVLYDACLEQLHIRPDGTYLDGTMGGAGHSSGILQALGVNGRLICLDRDPEAIEAGRKKLESVHSVATFSVHQARFSAFPQVIEALTAVDTEAIPNRAGSCGMRFDGVLLDLGFSSTQVDHADRGFSYSQDGPLDMRMDQTQGPTAAELVNTASEAELERILRDYGEERYARMIARAMIHRRSQKAFLTTQDLTECVIQAIPSRARKEKQHPAKRTFQALRIAVNNELGELEDFLQEIPHYMKPKGRLLIISFHSLEDRMVKKAMRDWEEDCICPPGLPYCICGKKKLGKAIPRKGITANTAELRDNPRARSARLRVFEFNRADG